MRRLAYQAGEVAVSTADDFPLALQRSFQAAAISIRCGETVLEGCLISTKTTQAEKPVAKAKSPDLTFRPLTPSLMDAMGEVLRGSWGASCWCMYPRLTDAQARELKGSGSNRREAMSKLARRKRAPGLLAFAGDEPVGWVAVGPRSEFPRIDGSKATPRVDNVDVWVIPCITVGKTVRGQGIAVELIKAAVAYAFEHGAPAVEAYPRSGAERTSDDSAFFGTEPLFRRAGFKLIREPLKDRPRNWIARVTMRVTA